MKKLLLSLALALSIGGGGGAVQARDTAPATLYEPSMLSSTFDTCANLFPNNKPIPLTIVSSEWKPRGLCSGSFAVLHSGKTKTPIFVVERMNRAQLQDAKDEERTNAFYADPRLPAIERADLRDYAKSGYDRGHMSPAADQPTATAMAQSFALSNMVPQDPVNNRKIWAKLEKDTRKYVMRAQGDVFVFSGPLYRATPKTIGPDEVWVPTHLFKLVYDASTGRAWAHILTNTSDAVIGKPITYAEFVQQTGWDVLPKVK